MVYLSGCSSQFLQNTIWQLHHIVLTPAFIAMFQNRMPHPVHHFSSEALCLPCKSHTFFQPLALTRYVLTVPVCSKRNCLQHCSYVAMVVKSDVGKICEHSRHGVITYKVTGINALYAKLCPALSFSKQLQSTLYFVITHYHCYTSDY
jgi:hypothetical protein